MQAEFKDVFNGDLLTFKENIRKVKKYVIRYYDDEPRVFTNVGGESDGKKMIYRYESCEYQRHVA
jgi:hypothetical protein